MEFEIVPGQIYGTLDDTLIFIIVDVNENYVTWKNRFPEGSKRLTKVNKQFFIEMYDQEKYWLSYPQETWYEYEWPRQKKRAPECVKEYFRKRGII